MISYKKENLAFSQTYLISPASIDRSFILEKCELMFIRIVKMSFAEENIETFLENFHKNKEKIRAVDGCHLLELLRDKDNRNQFFTYSYWDSEQDLETYRHSELFKGVWAVTKPFFNAKPEAWSVDKLVTLE